MPAPSFDFPAFRAAYEARDVAAWLDFFADEAEWIEYRPDRPACHRWTIGRTAIGEFLSEAAPWPSVLSVEEPEIDAGRVRFRAWLSHPDGRRIIEHVMLLTTDGRIRRQVDVEVWD